MKNWMLAVMCALALTSGAAHAQDYPTRPITIVVPFPAGGPTDTLARIFGDRVKVTLGQPLIVENVTGASAASASDALPKLLPTVTRSALAISSPMFSTGRCSPCRTIQCRTSRLCRC
jgi:tripartite-type tricarboxylate transporter receptor subunit TctC